MERRVVVLLADVRGQIGDDRAAHRAGDRPAAATASPAAVLRFAEGLSGPAVLLAVRSAAAPAPSAAVMMLRPATPPAAAAAAPTALAAALLVSRLVRLRAAVGLAGAATVLLLLRARRLHHKPLYIGDRRMCECRARK